MPVRKKRQAKDEARTQILNWCKGRGLKVVTEYQFHRMAGGHRNWRFDYCFPDYMIALEVEGAVHQQGRHTRGKGYEGDVEKYNEATIIGWRIIRASTGQVLSKHREVFKWLTRMFESIGITLDKE